MARTGLVVLGFLLLLPVAAFADEDGVPAGSLEGPGGKRFPLKHASVKAEITGSVAKVTVRQEFENPLREPIEALFTFPLPDKAGIHDFRMEIGPRVIRAELEERSKAMAKYSNAKAAGQTASILNQIRPNLFTQRLGNILPNERIVIEISYVEELKFEDGEYEFVFPMTVGPRYRRADGDMSKLVEDPGHRVSFDIRIDAGLPLDGVSSDSHVIDVRQPDAQNPGRIHVSLWDGGVLPSADFVLNWRLEAEQPEPVFYAHRVDETGYFGLMLHPDPGQGFFSVVPREIVFVIDTSGSMNGPPIDMARRVVRRTLKTLNAGDRFRIIRFSDNATSMSGTSLHATHQNVERGLKYVESLTANGGTEALTGLNKALLGDPREGGMIRIVHFVTDGLVGNEPKILATVKKIRGRTRIFPLGVGSSVNRFLLERMAVVGRGKVGYIRHDASSERIDEEVDRFVQRVRRPVLTNIEIDWGGLPVADVMPSRYPDLFAGDPLVLTGRFDHMASGQIVIRGRRAGQRYERTLDVHLPQTRRENSTLPLIWARHKIAEVMLEEYAGEAKGIQEEVVRLAIEHRLLTKHVAFVAVDERVVVDGGAKKTIVQPGAWPEGVGGGDFYGVILGPVPHDRFLGKGGPVRTKKRTVVFPKNSVAKFRPNEAPPGRHAAWLSTYQRRDGSFQARGDLFGDVGSTSLVLLSFRAAGYKPGEGIFGRPIKKGLDFLRMNRDRDGAHGDRSGDAWLLDHSLATITLLEYAAATGSGSAKRHAEQALRFLISRQSFDMGWSRGGSLISGDTLTTVFTILAMKRAEKMGIEVPSNALASAAKYLEAVVEESTGRVRSSLADEYSVVNGTNIAAWMLAQSVLATKDEKPNLLKQARLIVALPPAVEERADPLYLFLATSAMYRAGPLAFAAFDPPLNEAVRSAMIPIAATDAEGNPNLVGPAGSRVGRAAALALFGLSRSVAEPGSWPFTLR